MLSRKRPWNGCSRRNVWNYFSLFTSGTSVNTLRGNTVARRTGEHRNTIAFLTEQKLSLATCVNTRGPTRRKTSSREKLVGYLNTRMLFFPALCLRQGDIKFQICNRINWKLITASKLLRRYGSSPCIRIHDQGKFTRFQRLISTIRHRKWLQTKTLLLLIRQLICCLYTNYVGHWPHLI